MGIFSIVLISLNDNKLGSSILLGKKIRFRFLLFFINFYQQITIIIQIIITFLLTSLSLSLSLSLSTYTHTYEQTITREKYITTEITPIWGTAQKKREARRNEGGSCVTERSWGFSSSSQGSLLPGTLGRPILCVFHPQNKLSP